MICGNCNNHHDHAADVKACYTNAPSAKTSMNLARHNITKATPELNVQRGSLIEAGLRATAQRKMHSKTYLKPRDLKDS